VSLHTQQAQAWAHLHDDAVREVLYGGAKGGGKSWFGCVWSFIHTCEIAASLNIQPSHNPVVVGWMGRKQAVDFVDTTLETWKRTIPASAYQIRDQAREIVIDGRVKIMFGGLDHQADIQKFNSAEFAFLFLDQAEECSRNDIMALRASLRLTIGGQAIPRKALFTANPAACWLRDEFILAPATDQRFVRALPSDNPYLPADYTQTLRAAFKHRPELLEAYLNGRWDVFASVANVIREEWLERAAMLVLPSHTIRRVVVCDPARFGDDETVVYGLRETQIERTEIYGQKDLMHTANLLFVIAREFGANVIAVDSTGLGAGVADRLAEMGANVLEFESSRAATEPEKYHNLRAEIWDRAALMLSAGDVSLQTTDEVLLSQLLSPQYLYRNGRLLIESKDEIKERLGRSPDRADAYVMGLAALEFLARKRYHIGQTCRYRSTAGSSGRKPTLAEITMEQRANAKTGVWR